MTTDSAAPQIGTGTLLLADISGYSAFLGLVAIAHPEMSSPGGEVPPAYPVLSSLLDVVVETIAPTFRVAEIEGDAVFAYASDDQLGGGAEALLEPVRLAYGAFRARLEEAMVLQKHDCEACMLLPSLELKFVAHHGTFVVQQIAGRDRLLGPDVNVAHRLLKNSITEETGRRAYLFVTLAAAERLDLKPEIGVAHEEQYADVGSVHGVVLPLDRSTTAAGADPSSPRPAPSVA